MELKYRVYKAGDGGSTLLIVLNGIEIRKGSPWFVTVYLLIVLNGIEITKLNFIFMTFITFNRTKWN